MRTEDVIADGARLAALRELGLLEAPFEPDLDRYTSLAADLLGVPVSLISLVDHDRQVFASAHGLRGAWGRARETPLSHSLCKYAVITGEPLVIPDTRADPRTVDNLAVRDMSVLAYAGIPLVLADGNPVGTLCAIDSRPHDWSARELRILEDLAAAVRAMLDLRRALHQHSLQDPLTGLPNRALTVAYAEQLTRAHPDGDIVAVAIGVDDLRSINDGHGTNHGDRLIALLARRLACELDPEDVLGRLQGDTFVVLHAGESGQLAAVKLGHRLRSAAGDEPVTVRGEQLLVSATVGVAPGAPGLGGEGLIDQAVDALHHVKDESTRLVTTSAAHADARRRLRGPLAGAVRRGEIAVSFQPIVELTTGRTRGYEALARWEHPELGVVAPSEFIPAAETTGDIVLIGEHVLRAACSQLAAWRRATGSTELVVTVNVSPLQLAVANVGEIVADILRESGLPGSALTVEITEGVFVSPGFTVWRNLQAIRELGVQVALDDFGTGYSTLSYLKRFPVDLIKVDRCFLDGLETDSRDAALMRAILAIGAGLELDVVAEGVETRAQRELLRLSGCHWGQGFLFAEPRPAAEIELPLGTVDELAGAAD